MSKYLNVVRNRNPRNLDRLRISLKNDGFHFHKDKEAKQFYYRINFNRTNLHTTGTINHYKDGVILAASTMEDAIARRLHSTRDVSAAENIGRILAYRCLQSGILSVSYPYTEDPTSEAITAFYRAFEEFGVSFGELPVVKQIPHWEYPPHEDFGSDL